MCNSARPLSSEDVVLEDNLHHVTRQVLWPVPLLLHRDQVVEEVGRGGRRQAELQLGEYEELHVAEVDLGVSLRGEGDQLVQARGQELLLLGCQPEGGQSQQLQSVSAH